MEKAQEPNPHFDAALQPNRSRVRGHVRDGVILGPFDDLAAPHPTKFDPSFRTAQFCSRCLMSSLGAGAVLQMWGRTGPMPNTKANTSCRSGASSAKAATCRKSTVL